MTLAAVVGMVLSLLFFLFDKLRISNDLDEATEEAAEVITEDAAASGGTEEK